MRSGYENTWDELLVKVSRYSRNQRKTLMAEAETSGRLSLLEAATREWRQRTSAADAAARKAYALRLARTGELRPYADAEVVTWLPELRIKHPEGVGEQMRTRSSWARYFFATLDAGSHKRRTVAQIFAREANTAGQWALAHPYGPAVEPERLHALLADLRYVRNGCYDVLPTDVVVSPPPRLVTQIAMLLAS